MLPFNLLNCIGRRHLSALRFRELRKTRYFRRDVLSLDCTIVCVEESRLGFHRLFKQIIQKNSAQVKDNIEERKNDRKCYQPGHIKCNCSDEKYLVKVPRRQTALQFSLEIAFGVWIRGQTPLAGGYGT